MTQLSMDLRSALEKEKLISMDATRIQEPTNKGKEISSIFQMNGSPQECSVPMIKITSLEHSFKNQRATLSKETN